MLFKNLPYRQSFSSAIKPIVSEEKDALLSIASLNELSRFIPNIDINKDIDLLPIAFNACVINRVNKNGDIIDTDIALAMYKNFVNKFIDTEHNRQKVIGVILTASLSEFGTDRLLEEKDVIGTSKPFNITLGGIVWKAVNQELCDLIEESNDPTSSHYLGVSASWELGFSNYKIVELAAGEKNLINPIEISNPEEVESIKKYLKCFGGAGVKDGKSYYRMPNENVIPMGIGLTEKPAADVVGIAAPEGKKETESVNLSNSVEETTNKEEDLIKNQESFSHSIKNNVKIERENNMKITSIQDITDENLKQCSASAVAEFISSEIKKASEVYAKDKEEQMNLHHNMQKHHEELNKTVADMKMTMDALKKEKEDRENMDTFNARMSEVCSSYDLPQDVAKVVADDVKSCANEESYSKWKGKAEALLRPFMKKVKAEDMSEAKEKDAKDEPNEEVKEGEKEHAKEGNEHKEEDKKEDAKASVETKEAIATVVENALDNAKEEKAGLPNSSSATSPSLMDKYRTAFAEENFVIKK